MVAIHEISEKQINMLQLYMQTLAVPRQRNTDNKEVIQGNKLFKNIGCESAIYQPTKPESIKLI